MEYAWEGFWIFFGQKFVQTFGAFIPAFRVRGAGASQVLKQVLIPGREVLDVVCRSGIKNRLEIETMSVTRFSVAFQELDNFFFVGQLRFELGYLLTQIGD